MIPELTRSHKQIIRITTKHPSVSTAEYEICLERNSDSNIEQRLDTIAQECEETCTLKKLLTKTYNSIETDSEPLFRLYERENEVHTIPPPLLLAIIIYHTIAQGQPDVQPLFRLTATPFMVPIPYSYQKLFLNKLRDLNKNPSAPQTPMYNSPEVRVESEWRAWEALSNFLNIHLQTYGFEVQFSKNVEEHCDKTDLRMPDYETYVSSASVQLIATLPVTPQTETA